MKLAKRLWSIGSILINVSIITFLFLSNSSPKSPEERFLYLNDNWNVFEAHWKVEFLIMTMITIGAIYFAIHLKKMSWTIISVGQSILLITYPIILGGYKNTTFEIYEMANQISTIVFFFGNIVFLCGLLHLYFYNKILKNWLRLTAIGLSSMVLVAFSLAFVGLIEWKEAMMAGPLFIILYFINAYLGLKLKLVEK